MNLRTSTILMLTMAGLVVWSCSQSPMDAESTEIALAAAKEQAPAGTKFLPVIPRLQRGNYPLSTGHMVNNGNGGSVGGPQTEGNSVLVPPGALNDNQEFVSITVEGDGQFYAVDFEPSQDFVTGVEVTFYFGAVYEGSNPQGDLQAWWFNPDTQEYETVSTPIEIDESEGTMTFSVDHFSRYAWSMD